LSGHGSARALCSWGGSSSGAPVRLLTTARSCAVSIAHCHLGLGTLYQKAGRDEPSQAELATAAELYRAMEMTFWLEKAEAALSRVAG
jgi:hypothetical protein